LELEGLRKDGTEFPVELSVSSRKVGKTHFATAIVRDITERKRIEAKLGASENEYRALVESTEDSVYLVDRDCMYLVMNEKHLSRIGMPKDRVIGKTYGELHSEDETEEFAEIVEDVFETGKSVQHEHRSRRDYRYFLRTLSPVKDSEGGVTAVTVVSKEITERKQAEEELAKLASIAKYSSELVNLATRDGKMVFLNKAGSKMLGIEPDEVEQVNIIEVIPDHLRELVQTELLPALMQGKTWEGELQYRNLQTGVLTDVHAMTFAIKEPNTGNPLFFANVSMDITERKKAEKERESLLKELEAKNRELERFTYTVSHDLRSPLVTIQGFTDMVQNDLERNEPEKAKDNLTFIDKAATKMDCLLRDTLQLSRIGRMVNPPEDVPFGEIVKDALEQTAEQIKSSGVEISVAEDFPIVHVDRMRIAEVLVNLIANSINYRGEQSHPKIEIGHRIDNGESVFPVQDNGIGIDPGQHEKVFDLFYQMDTSGKKGTGAGLAIVKRIIEVHNGRIWIESEKGKGCTVCFTLPVQ